MERIKKDENVFIDMPGTPLDGRTGEVDCVQDGLVHVMIQGNIYWFGENDVKRITPQCASI